VQGWDVRLLPETPDLAAFRRLRRDLEAQRPAFVALAQRHSLPPSELVPFADGTHLVWGTRSVVLKVFVPLWPQDAVVEVAMLNHLAGTTLPVPRLEATGELDSWRYVVLSRLPGTPIGAIWPTLASDARQVLAARCGEAMAALHALSPPALPMAPVTQDELLAERLSRVIDEQRARGADGALLEKIASFVGSIGELPPAEPVLLHADLTADHFLVLNGELSGILDFADAFVGPWVYELAAPAGFVTFGDPAAQQALLHGIGRSVEPRSVRAWVVLHRYVHLATMLQGEALDKWLRRVWVP
jgi:hygromycin-B 7''-O-kinase